MFFFFILKRKCCECYVFFIVLFVRLFIEYIKYFMNFEIKLIYIFEFDICFFLIKKEVFVFYLLYVELLFFFFIFFEDIKFY